MARAQPKVVSFKQDNQAHTVAVLLDGKLFTSFIYPDSLEKPVLYPINTVDEITVTRGFPLQPRDGERTDHPHHLGLWLNYESVNGLDFWNNSYAIPADKKVNYGWIRKVKVEQVEGGKQSGELCYTANWEKQDQTVLLREKTTFIFSGTSDYGVIDRITTLTAQKETVNFKDIKDGMLGIRVTKELELPSDKPEEFTDAHGNVTKISPKENGATGNYLTSAGKTGDEAWGTRGNWCLLSGQKDGKTIGIAMIDHPSNPGYPTYWHARGYGLFAANPLGQNIFSNGKENLNLTLKPAESVTFRYRILVQSGKPLTAENLNLQAAQFAKMNK
ncbi:MAG: PmoA family protein [Sphingobacteriaceae bacterium]